MKFSIIPILCLLHTAATAAVTGPHGPTKTVRAEVDVVDVDVGVDVSPAFSFNEAEVFAIVAPQGCSILSCVSVIGQAVCIAGAIASGNIAALLGCASKKKLCDCADCFNALGGFLRENGIC